MRKLTNIELNRPNIKDFKSLKKNKIILVLDNIRSGHNVGAIFRNCDAFLVEKIIISGITPVPPNKEIRKTALGAENSVSWVQVNNLIEELKKLKNIGYCIISVEQVQNSIKLEQINFSNKKIVLIFGNEIKGVSEDVIDFSDKVVEITQYGTKHSLNVSVTSAICLWEILKVLKGN